MGLGKQKKGAAAAPSPSGATGKRNVAAGKKAGKAAGAASQSTTAAAAADVLAQLRREADAGGAEDAMANFDPELATRDDSKIPLALRNTEAAAAEVLRNIGDHINTRLGGADMEVDDEGIGRDAFGNADDEDADGEDVDTTFRPLAAAVPAAAVQQASTLVATGQASAADAALFVGHNRNSVTAVTLRGDMIIYADKLGVVTKVNKTTGVREMLLPHVDAPVLAIAVSDTSNVRRNHGMTRTTADLSVKSYLAAGTSKGLVRIWDLDSMSHVGDLTLHRAAVTGLAFRLNSSVLLSVSQDKVVRAWSLTSMAPIDRYFGNQSGINALAVLRSERCVTVGDDRTPRLWKLDRATQTSYASLTSPGDAVAMIDDMNFVVGTRGGSLLLFDALRRTAVWQKEFAHGYGWGGDGTGLEREHRSVADRFGVVEAPAGANEAFGNGITALTCVPFSDLVVSGSCDGFVRLWRFRSPDIDPSVSARTLELVGQAAVFGFVNGLAISADGREIIAAVGKEPRFGRWNVQRAARNGVQRIPLTTTGVASTKSVLKQVVLPEPTPAADLLDLRRMAAEARRPTERETMLQQRVAKKQQSQQQQVAAATPGAKSGTNATPAGKKKPAGSATAQRSPAPSAQALSPSAGVGGSPLAAAGTPSTKRTSQPASGQTPRRNSNGGAPGTPEPVGRVSTSSSVVTPGGAKKKKVLSAKKAH